MPRHNIAYHGQRWWEFYYRAHLLWEQLRELRELRENAKKIKQRIREQEIDNIDLNVTKLQDLREDEETDLK
jgi:uncharacterized protein YydD (DUF2326 family)